jgi:hypothetical protein
LSDVIIQSFHPYSMQMAATGRDKDGKRIGSGKVYTLPARSAAKNILLIDEADFPLIEQNVAFKSLLKTGKIRKLDNIPKKYKSSDVEIAEAHQKVKDAKAESQSKDAEIEALKAKIAEQEKAIADLGGEREPKKSKKPEQEKAEE